MGWMGGGGGGGPISYCPIFLPYLGNTVFMVKGLAHMSSTVELNTF